MAKKPKAELAQPAAGAAPSIAVEGADKPAAASQKQPDPVDDAERRTIELGWPLPAELPAEALDSAVMVVRAKCERGFRRAGIGFTAEETEVRFADLTPDQRDAIGTEPNLIVSVRLVAP